MVNAAVGAAAMGVWSATSTTASSALIAERRQGTLELVVASPTPFPVVILPITLSMSTVGLYSMVATLAWGRVAFGIPLDFAHPVGLAVAAVVTVLAISVVGYLQAVVCVRLRAAWALGSALELPIWLVCGFLVPLSALPAWAQPISWVLPPTWGLRALRAAAEGGAVWPSALLCLVLSSVFLAGAAVAAGRLVVSARAEATLALS